MLTEGIFLNRLQADPELAGVSSVLFDEVHERSLDSDFGLALALDAQQALRPDLRIVAMSATLDGARFAALMGPDNGRNAALIESEGRSFPITLRHLGRSPEKRIEDEMAAAIRRALGEAEGSLLAFLPGVAEIERTAERLEPLPGGVMLHRLHGSLEPAAQRAAIAPPPPGARKLVLATSIAETSLTLDGVRIVVDSGLARRPRYDRAAGVTQLVTERASQAAVTQRAGRAGRQGPGIVYRLWEEAATAGLPRFDPPEIVEADLSALLLDCALWGVADPRTLKWIDPPPAAAVEEARRRLRTLGAIDQDGRPTDHGRAIAALPLPPRLAHMIVEADARGWGRTAAETAVLLSERGLGGNDPDLELRLRRWRGEKGQRAEAARGLARRWLGYVDGAQAKRGPEAEDPPLGACIALAFPDRVAKRRSADGADWISVGGRGFRLDPLSPLAREPWLAVAEVSGAAAGARVIAAAPIAEAMVERLFADRIESGTSVEFVAETGGVRASRGRRLGAITLSGGQDSRADPAMIAASLNRMGNWYLNDEQPVAALVHHEEARAKEADEQAAIEALKTWRVEGCSPEKPGLKDELMRASRWWDKACLALQANKKDEVLLDETESALSWCISIAKAIIQDEVAHRHGRAEDPTVVYLKSLAWERFENLEAGLMSNGVERPKP